MMAELLLLNALQMYLLYYIDMALAIGDKSKITWIITAVISVRKSSKSTI